MVQWLEICASIAGGTRLIPGQRTKTPHAVLCGIIYIYQFSSVAQSCLTL